MDSLPAEPQGKPKNTGVGSLSLLQRICLTQEKNWSLLHCRQILYQLSYEGRIQHRFYSENNHLISVCYNSKLLYLKSSKLGLLYQKQTNKNAKEGDLISVLSGWEDPLEKGQAIHSTILRLPSWPSW